MREQCNIKLGLLWPLSSSMSTNFAPQMVQVACTISNLFGACAECSNMLSLVKYAASHLSEDLQLKHPRRIAFQT